MPGPIHQEVTIAASPARLYEAFLDATQFSAATGAPAEIDRAPGGAFSCFGGAITGRTVELVPNQRIVQAWRVVSWPEGAYSIVRFALSADGNGSRLVLDHAGFAEEEREHLDVGWPKQYWEPLRHYLASRDA